ncbi:beta-glucosidase family protein [Phytoactinopolyspora halotolerans]|uniref:Glycosyl hydrolase n=1 Tax=Phytoactinopolyspora halotolerans TaxID=1981512 RepID=A0A6L9SHG2_9ACTN|nr:glycoside hydrolase family 3 C-terminal domain-containing protein [Phytoactinopolyspora halotolerans]NEE03530.1 glycosyl hydrolase [Phytoactinopolyspora halotolerans]
MDHHQDGLDQQQLETLLRRLTLEEKVALLTGADMWSTVPLEKIGLRRILMSDGPSGVRGEIWDERDPSLNLPSATALSSAWDTGIARRYGAVCAAEARRKGVDVVLGPTINLHRSPLGGRHFEAFSEDPLLTADLAAAYVAGLQDNGVAATLKHYLCNDFETDRFTVDVDVDDRALREVYLLAFEKAVVEARAWLVMSSYNSVNGSTLTESPLLAAPLKDEWGFDGVVVSDWAAVRSLDSARYAQDLVMPGPKGPWGDALVAAVQHGEVDELTVDRKVYRLLRLAARVGALGTEPAGVDHPADDGVAFAREAAAAGTVLLRNDGELPWNCGGIKRIAVIGHNAKFARTQGGGSATVIPERTVSPLDGIRRAFPDAELTYALGAVVQEGVAALPLEHLTNPITGEPGLRARFLDAVGGEISAEDRRSAALVWFGGTAPIDESARLELSTWYTPETTGTIRLGFAAVGVARIVVDGRTVLDTAVEPDTDDLASLLLAPPSATAAVNVTEGVPIDIRVEYELGFRPARLAGSLAFTLGIEPDDSDPEGMITAAVSAARAADVAVVVVGTDSRVESEGHDRRTLELPGRQDDLVRAVAAANPRTVAVVNSGAPVLLPWRDEVAAVLVSYFGGQEFGHALADVLSGAVEPGGRLPTTWPATLDDVPVLNVTPADGVVHYDEGIHIGYRAWLRSRAEPAYPFGHGLGYTSWELSRVASDRTVSPGGAITVSAILRNTGQRPGKHVVQVYAERPSSAVDRPVRWLVGHAPVWADPGQSVPVAIPVPARAFAHWDDGWRYEPGVFTLRVGSSVRDLPGEATVSVLS